MSRRTAATARSQTRVFLVTNSSRENGTHQGTLDHTHAEIDTGTQLGTLPNAFVLNDERNEE
ncbi:hypothetical protein E2C01_050002 [Portunus trituberculatus]|uniref:Uncharacterized protein n=1 Tax=Portunus trituberculatus TaxID=210409 RepID=A0A5B7GFD2_PORTR|nr:hypothetical protein [Portunus trituberculatus]